MTKPKRGDEAWNNNKIVRDALGEIVSPRAHCAYCVVPIARDSAGAWRDGSYLMSAHCPGPGGRSDRLHWPAGVIDNRARSTTPYVVW